MKMLSVIANTWGQEFSNFIFTMMICGGVIAICVIFRDFIVSVFKIKKVLDKLDEVSGKLDDLERKISQIKRQ
jgi:hypothetical protein